MSECTKSASCVFYQSVEPSLVKRIRFAGAFPYCRGGRHDECAIHVRIEAGDPIPPNLMPDGTTGDYLDEAASASATVSSARGKRFLVVDDSPVFAALAANALRQNFPEADVVQCHAFDEAESHLGAGEFALVVSGNGLGGGRTVADVRRLTFAPIVLFTGRPVPADQMPSNSRLVQKGAGPEALRLAAESLLGA
jgi:hypothetical protein